MDTKNIQMKIKYKWGQFLVNETKTRTCHNISSKDKQVLFCFKCIDGYSILFYFVSSHVFYLKDSCTACETEYILN